MDNDDWPLTSRAIADSERAAGQDEYDLADTSDPRRGNALLRALVAEPEGRPEQDGRVAA